MTSSYIVLIFIFTLDKCVPIHQSQMSSLNIKSTCPLNNGIHIPYLGLGVYDSSACTKACLTSFDEDYRHVDTAQLYGNEAEVGVAILTCVMVVASLVDANSRMIRKPFAIPHFLAPRSSLLQKSGTINIRENRPSMPSQSHWRL